MVSSITRTTVFGKFTKIQIINYLIRVWAIQFNRRTRPIEGVSKKLPPQDKEDESAGTWRKDHSVQRSEKLASLPT